MKIKFGTSGWRDIIAENFTYENVKLVTQAIADYINQKFSGSKKVIVGYDTRFMSEDFAKISCCVLSANGIKSLYSKRDIPTPTVAYEIVSKKLAGGINFTASHNPAEYNGLKFSPDWGGPALPETTQFIEKRCEELMADRSAIKEMDYDIAKKKGLIEEIDSRMDFLKRIKQLVDIKSIKKAKLKIGVDLLYGTSRGYLDILLKECGCKLEILHDWRDVLFGGHRPEPNEENLKGLIEIVKKKKFNLGLSCDGDADRFGIVDSDGSFITPNQVIALLLYHLVKSRNWKGGIAVRSVMTSHFLDSIAKGYDVEVKETPVGFKFIGGIMVENPDRFIIGGEESGGLTIRGHVPEKDGILACMLIAEMVAQQNKPIRKILQEIEKKFGKFITKRVNLSLTKENMEKFKEKLKTKPPEEFAGLKVKNLVTIDGFKFILEDGSWVGMRLSGTEPIVRLYIESNSEKKVSELVSSGKKFITS